MLSHDQTFKNLIADYLLVALRFIVSAMTATWPENVRVTLIRQEQSKERLGDTFQELDIPLRVEFPDGSKETLVIVIENETRKRPEFLHYLAIVCLQISLQQKTKRVVPVAFFPFRKKPLPNTLTLKDDDHRYLDFSCLNCVLGTMNARDWEKSKNIVARLCLPLMKHDPKDKALVVLRAYEGLSELEPDESKRIKYSEFLGMYAKMNKREVAEFRDKYVARSPFREDIMTLASVLKKEGRTEGMAIGEARGVVRGVAIGEARGEAKALVALHSNGLLTAAQTRQQLKALLRKKEAPKDFIENALKGIKE